MSNNAEMKNKTSFCELFVPNSDSFSTFGKLPNNLNSESPSSPTRLNLIKSSLSSRTSNDFNFIGFCKVSSDAALIDYQEDSAKKKTKTERITTITNVYPLRPIIMKNQDLNIPQLSSNKLKNYTQETVKINKVKVCQNSFEVIKNFRVDNLKKEEVEIKENKTENSVKSSNQNKQNKPEFRLDTPLVEKLAQVDQLVKKIKKSFSQNIQLKTNRNTILAKSHKRNNTIETVSIKSLSLNDKKITEISQLQKMGKRIQKNNKEMSHISSKVSLLINDSRYVRVFSKISKQTLEQSKKSPIKTSIKPKNNDKFLKNRPNLPIEDLLLQKGKIMEYKLQALKKMFVPTFKPEIISCSRVKDTEKVFNHLYSSIKIPNNSENHKGKSSSQNRPQTSLHILDNKNSSKDLLENPNLIQPKTLSEPYISLKKMGNTSEFFFKPQKFALQNSFYFPTNSDLRYRTSDKSVQKDNSAQKDKSATHSKGFGVSNQKKMTPIRTDELFKKSAYFLLKKETRLNQIRQEKKEIEMKECSFKPKLNKKQVIIIHPNEVLRKVQNNSPVHGLKSPDSYIQEIMKNVDWFQKKNNSKF